MTNPLQLRMGVEAPHRNRYLFSDHYLESILPHDPRWEQGLDEAELFCDWLRARYADEQDQLPDYNESQLEEHWFRPIFEELGHIFETQASVPGLEAHTKRPDYVFFPDESARQTAASLQNEEAYAAEALTVGEVKRWDTPLGKKRKGGGPSFEDRNPSWQIDYYVRATGLDWGILTNGRLWRLVHEDTSHRLQIYYEVDLVQLLEEADPDRMRYFTLFFCQAAFRPDRLGRVFLDDALAASNAYAVELEEDLEENVYHALERLMQGFLDLPTNNLVADDLKMIYDNSLYLLYRLLFILYGESRGLLPLDNDQYRDSYSLTHIKSEIAELEGTLNPRTTLYWGQIKNLFHIISGDDAQLNRSLGVPRYDGGLFDPQQHPFLEKNVVGDQALVEAIDLLSRRTTEAGREFADYRTLNERHLGSIYEGLLEYQPRLAEEPMVAVGDEWMEASEAPDSARVVERRGAGEIYLETDRGERKATGSYYTPQYIVEYIVEHTLGPLIEEATACAKSLAKETGAGGADKRHPGEVLVDEILDLQVLDPAMGSGHFLVEATEFLALALATDPYVTTEETAEEDKTYWMRRVVERCIYGVDKNPLAVELAKLSLWLATVAADRPLSFLDHHLKCGDSLIGARVEDLGWAPPPVLSKQAQKQVEQQKAGQMNMFEHILSQMLPTVMGRILEITEQESKDYDTVRAKEAADRAVRELKAPFEAVADLWTSGYFGNEFEQGDYDEALGVIGQPETLLGLEPVERARAMADERRFFHWELAFPEVFYDEHGQRLKEQAGFDAVVGNPPYVRVQTLQQTDSVAASYFSTTYRTASGSYDIYMLITERCQDLVSGRGIVGLILPNKFLTASYGKGLRKRIAQQRLLFELVDFTYGQVFDGVTTYTCLLFLRGTEREFARYAELEDPAEIAKKENLSFTKVPLENLTGSPWAFIPPSVQELLDRIDQRSIPLKTLSSHLFQGIRTGANEVYVLQNTVTQGNVIEGFSSSLGRRVEVERDLCVDFARGEQIGRYEVLLGGEALIFPYETQEGDAKIISLEELRKHFPLGYAYIKSNEDLLKKREDGKFFQDKDWHSFARHQNLEVIREPKILTRDIISDVAYALDDDGSVAFVTGYGIILEPGLSYTSNYVLAILNSEFGDFALKQINTFLRGGYARIFSQYLEPIPIRRIDFTTPADKRDALVAEAKDRAERAIQALAASGALGSDAPMDRAVLAQAASPALSFVKERLSAEPEQADVIHDLLAHLAERMIAMHERKQERVEAFWLDLEGVTDADAFEDLSEHGKWGRSLWRASEDCRPFVGEESRSTRHLDESLAWTEDCFKPFVKALAGRVQGFSDLVAVYRDHSPAYRALVQRIAATDRLIDLIVYRLYGLTDEEIAVVEGR